MISAITVAYTQFPDSHIENLIDSLTKMSKKIDELIVVYNKDEPFYRKEKIGKILIKHISPKAKNIIHFDKKSKKIYSYEKTMYQDHAFALHKGIEYANNKYIMLTDPDVVFICINLMKCI